MTNKCAVENCLRARLPDAVVCRVHMGDLWGNRLDSSPSGFVPRIPEWRRNLRAKEMRDAA